jgi:hypothetical protein
MEGNTARVIGGDPRGPVARKLRVVAAAAVLDTRSVFCRWCRADICNMCGEHWCWPKCTDCGGTCSCDCGWCPNRPAKG